MTDTYCFPSLLFIKENIQEILGNIYDKDETCDDYNYDFLVFNEAERILKSKDVYSIRSLISLVQIECKKYVYKFYRENKHNPNMINFNIEQQAETLKKLFFNKIN